MDESTLLGYAASHKMVMDETSIKQNLQISHLSMDEPFPLRLCSPVLCNEDMVGFISVSEIRGGFLSKEDQQFFTTLCMLLGMSLRNVRTLKHAQDSLASSEQLLYEKNALNERIRQLFGKFTSPSVVDSLIENQEQIALGGESKVLSAMFCDIRGFTTYCENRTPEQVVDALNEYLTRMSEVVLKYHGTLDKYIGDEIMAFWGAPLSQAHHAKLAVQASYEMLVELKKLSVAWQRDGREAFQIGVGVNTGRMIVGNIGSSMRMDYTIIGDSVNLASRVQGLTRKFQTNLLITEYTYQWVKDIVKVKKIGTLQVKGKQQPVTIYSVEWVDLKPLSNGA
jgi:class 3 adenylate cyclase